MKVAVKMNDKYVDSITIEQFNTRSGKGRLYIEFNKPPQNPYNVLASTNGGGKTFIIESLYRYLNENKMKFLLINNYSIFDENINNSISKLDVDQFDRFKHSICHFSSESMNYDIDDLVKSKSLEWVVRILLKLASSNISVLLWDYIEFGLHIDYQRKLFNSIRLVAPNTQIICTTQSPGMIIEGYFDCIFELSDCITKE